MHDNECIKRFMEDLIAKNIKHTILVLVRKAGPQRRLFKNDWKLCKACSSVLQKLFQSENVLGENIAFSENKFKEMLAICHKNHIPTCYSLK